MRILKSKGADHLVQFEDGRRRWVTQDELFELQRRTGDPTAELSDDGLEMTITAPHFETEVTYLHGTDNRTTEPNP